MFVLAVSAFLSGFGTAGAGSSSAFSVDLKEVLDSAIDRHNGIGVSAAVIVPGRMPWLGVSGVSHESTSITPDMIFGAGSTTKSFMAALILQLVEEKQLSLEDPIGKYLPSYPNISGSVTIHQLLNHTSGIYNVTEHSSFWDTILWNRMKSWSPEEILQNFVSTPYFSPGEGWHYSNTNYILLGMLAEAVTGSKVSSELRNRFLTPLGLTRTFLEIEEQITGTVAHRWYDFYGDGTPDDISFLIRTSEFSAYWTAGAMFSTAEDLAKWAQALFGGSVLKQSSLDQMLTFHSPTPGEPQMAGYGLGALKYAPEVVAQETAYGHGGWVIGYQTVLAYLPDYDVTISIIINENNDDCLLAIADGLVRVVLKYLPKRKPMPWIPLLLFGEDSSGNN